ncbi:adenine phosphoribosyltransferase [Fodinicola acaciae]|uniref:adenine phosphoribosyltransferase n=1 Tax=Fodinicola acaciae TaxID=2681555 RepID=UPI0013D796E3|nr:adenine phosphoribosyltransferase [Fodinicola acaciae]
MTDAGTATSGTTGIAQLVADHVVDVPDFPRPGILFKDLTPLFGDGAALRACADAVAASAGADFDLVAGIEARGFIVAAAVGYATGRGVVPVRKAGKLPGPTTAITYELEYGTATLEIPQRSGVDGRRVLLVDDVLATGGTVVAAAELLSRGGGSLVGVSVVLELAALTGRKRIAATHSSLPVHALLSV